MSLLLPRLVVFEAGSPGARIAEAPSRRHLRQEEAAALVARSRASSGRGMPVAHCEPLSDARWAVGGQLDDVAIWRILGEDLLDRIGGHPAWLWTNRAWFDLERPATVKLSAPTALPLRQLLQRAAPALGGEDQTAKVLASLISALRTERPTALVVDRGVLLEASAAMRWLALAALTLLPPTVRRPLRISLGVQDPDPREVDLALSGSEPPGFTVVHADEPLEQGKDLVSYFIRNRLCEDDPEALEAAAWLFDGPGDRWGESVAALIRDGIPGTSEITPDQVHQDPEEAVQAFAARLQAGAGLTPEIVEELIEITLATLDPRPWQVLWRRPAVQRANAVRALLDRADRIRPGAALIRELCSIYPRGAPLDRWLPGLLGWLDRGAATSAVVSAIQTTLLEWPQSATGPIRAAVWSDVVASLVRLGLGEEAAEALVRSPVAAEIARDGSGRELVEAWATVPPPHRTCHGIEALVDMLYGAPNGDQAVAELFLHVQSDAEAAETLARAWVRHAAHAPSPDDPVLAAIRGTSTLGAWGQALAELPDPTTLQAALRSWAPDPRDPLRRAAGEGDQRSPRDPSPRPSPRPGGRSRSARERLVSVDVSDGVRPSTEAKLLAIAQTALSESRFPDQELASLAAGLAGQPETNRVWGWIALAAGAPGTWDDDTVDATVVAFCLEPPTDPQGEGIALQAARNLGASRAWEPLDHARWMVRLSLAPPGPLNQPLAKALLEGIGIRTDNTPFVAKMFMALLELPPDHPAINWMLELLIPSGWRGERLARLLRSIPSDRVPRQLRDAWAALSAAAGAH
ncbi:MAG TPA: hypothetical protein ENK18_01560 [Deltaproteobacteria bacterium]|nr:hypothetical protein [Deltaproteobacteria bacterium]